MTMSLYSQMHKKFLYAGTALAIIVSLGTAGYWLIGGTQNSFIDCLYMTVITITTIGYSEIIDMSGNPWGRVFTMFIALSGISTATYILTNLTAFMVEGNLSTTFRRRKMEKSIKKLSKHYVVCGAGSVGLYVLRELIETKRPHVVIEDDSGKIEKILDTYRDTLFIEGDATESDVLLSAGVKEAKGVFAVTGDDNRNLVISFSAKQLNPNLRVVARCHDLKDTDKMKKAGADAVVSPSSIGGMRMASEMVRATAVSFLDTMLRDKNKNLRVEEVSPPESFAGNPISALRLKEHPSTLLLAVKTGDAWIYNPSPDYVIDSGDTLIFMTTPEERSRLEHIFRSAT